MHANSPRRPGTTILEVTIALLVVSAAMLALVQMLSLVTQQRRLTEIRRLALQEAANQAEQVAVLAWDQAAPGQLTSWMPSEGLKAAVPSAACKIEVTEEAGPPAARRVRLEVSWTDAAGQTPAPVELTVWKFPAEEAP